MFFRRGARTPRVREIAPEDIFLDSSNLPGLSRGQFEGRVERPVSVAPIFAVGICFALVVAGFGYRAFSLQVVSGETYAEISRENTLDRSLIFATRGVIYDRRGEELAWNEAQTVSAAPHASSSVPIDTRDMYALRVYRGEPGLSHVLGFVQYPKADAKGNWWREEYAGISGVELAYESLLAGKNGSAIVETNALGKIERENIMVPAQNGADLKLSIDAELQSKLYSTLWSHAQKQGFKGGAAVIMDVRTGELIALTSFPEYDNMAFVRGDSDAVRAVSSDTRTPLLNRAVAGLYTPGSIVKPMFAIAALEEGIIDPRKEIVSTGALTVPNPYDPARPTVFRDWAAHGAVDMRRAIAVSSDVYFYVIGGGFGAQKGLGIYKIDEYARLFGLASTTGIDLKGDTGGIIPTPEWKARIFGENDPWRVGNTYHTVIGQYGFQISPLHAVRFTAAIANGGKLLKPQLLASSTPEFTELGLNDANLQVAREGMRMAVMSDLPRATVRSLNIPGIEIAGKTGTAELGTRNEYMNSWSVGYWPADDPKYAFAVVLERAPAGTLSGASPGLQPFFYWLVAERPEYVK
jgi:penicillin-binding protein 2